MKASVSTAGFWGTRTAVVRVISLLGCNFSISRGTLVSSTGVNYKHGDASLAFHDFTYYGTSTTRKVPHLQYLSTCLLPLHNNNMTSVPQWARRSAIWGSNSTVDSGLTAAMERKLHITHSDNEPSEAGTERMIALEVYESRANAAQPRLDVIAFEQ